ncbi:unnamed protein product [Spirodela intermedia]|uniref:Sodium/calcium exchanger membrane region domain-containing protein n=1 Tax=Spirodela intermedia TaxID=51605 RepID=A0A7I8J4D7_SPIIN|nr:unnamed protein product [Spirodela intermedia]CAA6664220.1 unnamed protein product [Spirodela intermedia]
MSPIPRRRRGLMPVSLLNIAFSLLLFVAFYNKGAAIRVPFLWRTADSAPYRSIWKQNLNPRRHLGELSIGNSTAAIAAGSNGTAVILEPGACSGIAAHRGYPNECSFIKSHPQCSSGGFIDYLRFFYCDCENLHFLGYAVMAMWLAALFYLLGNTAADYFCSSLEKLSGLLRLPPPVAGVTLLPWGTGRTGDVGVNSVLGGAVFVTCVVVGVVSICVAEKRVQIDRRCFIRDVVFFLLTLLSLSFILATGKIAVWGAVLFVSLYLVYAFSVAANELLRKHARRLKLDVVTPLLLLSEEHLLSGGRGGGRLHLQLPARRRRLHPCPAASARHATAVDVGLNVAIYSNQGPRGSSIDNPRPLWGWSENSGGENPSCSSSNLLHWIEMPLSLPRRLTIPIVEEDRWSKGYAVTSALLAPLLLAILWISSSSRREGEAAAAVPSSGAEAPFLLCGLAGISLSTAAFFFTRSDRPPQKFLLPWVLAGFVMSIVWFYIIANELVALLPAILGLTVLAWGNSMGDLMSNVALAMNGGGDGVQIAMSGCYAGPIFNTLAGLGISLLLSAWSTSPAAFVLPRDASLPFTLGFLMLGLIWALVILPHNDMRPSKLLGSASSVCMLSSSASELAAQQGSSPSYLW